MQVFILSKGRARSISTHRLFSEDYHVVVHDQREHADYLTSVPAERLLVSDVPSGPGGKTRQMAWVCANFVSADEWFIFADDNIREMTAVTEEFYKKPTLPVQDGSSDWKEVFNSTCSQDRFRQVVAECITYCDDIGAQMCGFATNRNYYFRGRKWRHVGYVLGKLLLWRNCEYAFDDRVGVMDDFRDTAEHLLRFGVVGINNYVYPVAGHYEPGGHGTYSERKETRKRDVKFLMKQYPDLFRIKERTGFESGTELAIRFTSQKQVARWRRDLPMLRLQARGIRGRG